MAVFALVGWALCTSAAESAMHFNSYAMDGPFQLFNSLRRISVGQRIGDTFQFFHGPGIPYLFFPAFAAGGWTFVAAELSRQLVNSALFLASTLVLMRAMVGSWRKAVPLAIVAIIVIVEFRLESLTYPVNSLLGTRSTMPLFVAAHLLMRAPSRRADVERGVLLGLAMLLGTEQAMASVAALAITRAAISLRQGHWRIEASRFAVEASTAVATFLVVVFALAGSSTASVLRFNFGEVPQDQFWYFGAPPNPFLSRWSEIPPMLADHTRWWIIIAAGVVIGIVQFWHARPEEDPRRPMTGLFLIVYAVISLTSMLGLYMLMYAQPAARVGIFMVIGWAYDLGQRWRDRAPALSRFKHLGPVGVAVLVLVGYLREPLVFQAIATSAIHVPRDHILGSERPQLSEAWVATEIAGLSQVELLRRELNRTPTIWSTYAGLLEWQVGVLHPATDYIIHALGPKRRAEYAAKFVEMRPELVQTIRPSYTYYEEWLEGTHWDFYRPLLERYDVSATGPWSFFWTLRRGPPLPKGNVIFDMAAPPGASTIATDPHLSPDSVGLFEIRLRYHTRNPLRPVPVFGGLPRYLIDLPGSADRYAISLAPYATERSFPVVVRGGTPITIRASVASLTGVGSITLDSIRIERIPISRVNGIWMRDFLTRDPLAR
jgi:hypothetical protein